MNIFSEIGPFFYLVLGLSIFIISITMFVNFVRGITILIATLSIGYYILIASPSTKKTMDNYANRIYHLSQNNSYVKTLSDSAENAVIKIKQAATK